MYHVHTKHIEVDYHFVQEKVLRRDLQIKYIATGDQLANVFTKSLSFSISFSLLQNHGVS